MRPPSDDLNASQAATRLGVSTKALRLYEQRGLLTPTRTAAGYRCYSPAQMRRAAGIVRLRALGLSLSQVAQVVDGDAKSLEAALAAHETRLAAAIEKQHRSLEQARAARAELAGANGFAVAADIELPWPWGGESFAVRALRPLTYIVGPLGSGKTRLARRLAQTLPHAVLLGPQRVQVDSAALAADLDRAPERKARVGRALQWLVRAGASESTALIALLAGLETDDATITVVDMVEQGLDQATQEALMTYLRRRAQSGGPACLLMTRSAAILDLTLAGADEAIIFCPANHSPPTYVTPRAGSPGYEGVASCLAAPEVRARLARRYDQPPPSARKTMI